MKRVEIDSIMKKLLNEYENSKNNGYENNRFTKNGTTENQIIRLKERLAVLTEHAIEHSKDISCLRGINKINSQLSKLFKYYLKKCI